ncbi:MAG: hypothetical protein IPK85_02665 [Gemmatimonadetes bacterium]|nr:hypothetical protein [Gemmatimonadota bacterium]
MPAQTEYSAPAWGKSPFFDLELPSGGVVQCKLIDLQVIVAADMIDEFDKLAPTADEKVVKPASGKRPADRKAKEPTKKERAKEEAKALREFFAKDNIDALTTMMSRVLPLVIVQPAVETSVYKTDSGTWETIPPQDRKDGVIYVDTVPLADQMTILQATMEGMDMDGLQQFREQPQPSVADVEVVPVRTDPPI